MRRARAAAALVLTGAAAAACSTSAPAGLAGAGSTADVPRLTAEVTQYRRDQPLRRVQVKLASGDDADVVVESLQLRADGFAPGPVVAKDTRLVPGARVDLPAAYGEPRCGDPTPTPAGPPVGGGTVVLAVRRGDAGAAPLTVPLSTAGGVLALVHERECRAQRLAGQVDLSFAPAWPEQVRDGRPALLPTLVVRRRGGDQRVVVADVGGHVLFTVRPAAPARPPLLVLEPGQQRAELPLTVTTTRCDGHALAESKRTPLFLFYVAVGDDEPRVVLVAADPGRHAALSAFATRSCRGAG